MYLKSIEVQGFKSFANKIKFEFHNGITAIVGPNGSGKSNVADAVRWVLGEQSSKQLRGSSMQDVIFSGTEMRKPLGYAYVAITLDNSDHSLAIDFDEVTVARRLYRSGESEYLINGANCRLKDINELFYDTGIGKEGYSIIGQGQIDKILSGKPEDRRELFDEAAGIVKFKLRKDTAVKKLENEKVNLTRIADIIAELEKQIEPLSKQSETAKVYLKAKEELKALDVNVFLLENARLKEQLETTTQNYDTASRDLSDVTARYDQTRTEYDRVQAELEQLDAEISAARDAIADAQIQREKLEGQIGILNEKINAATGNESHFQTRIASIQESIREKESEKAEVLARKQKIDEELNELLSSQESETKRLEEIQDKLRHTTEEIDEHKATILKVLEERATIKSRLSSLTTMRDQNNIRKAELTSKLVRARSDESRQEEAIRELKEIFDRVTEELSAITDKQHKAEEGLQQMKSDLASFDASLRDAQSLFHQDNSKLEALRGIAERYEGYGGSVKRVMEKKGEVKGIVGVVADIIKADKEHETAIEIALGASIQNVVTEDEATAKKMIAFLKETQGGRVTFLPLDSIREAQELKAQDALKEYGVIGLASELVHTEERYRSVAESLLGRIIVVDEVDHATTIARKYNYTLRIVTLDGELLTPGGAISGGRFKNGSNFLGRRREMEDLEKKIATHKEAIAAAEKGIEDTKRHRNELREEIEKYRLEEQSKILEQNTARLNVAQEEERKKENEGSYTSLKSENEEIENRLQEIGTEEEEANAQLATSEETEHNANARIAELEEALRTLQEEETIQTEKAGSHNVGIETLKTKQGFEQENIDRIEEEIAHHRGNLNEVEESLKTSQSDLEQNKIDIETIKSTIERSIEVQTESDIALKEKSEKRTGLSEQQKSFFTTREQLSEQMSSLDKEVTRLSAQKERFQENIENQINYMWNEYEITLTDAAELRNEEMTDLAQMKRDIGSVREQIRKLGDVNVNAIEDYKNLMERYTLMKTQHDDLVEAENQLREIIAELDENMRRQFTEQFTKINTEFDHVFKELFGGGKGALELVEEEDILTAGIRIIAQPPGKKLQNMMMLSGGEKALTAIALLFAIQNLKPSPFCLLDEIEAALDENNVTRFAKYLHKLTKNIQFIVITHRRGTMESADRLYGITMQEKGVSALVSVNLIDKDLED